MMKKILLLMVSAAMLLALAGCDRGQSDLEKNASTEVDNNGELQAEEVEGLRQQVAMLEAQIEELEQQVKELEVQVAEAVVADNVATVVNPVREVTLDEMVEATGIPLYVPTDAMNVAYYVIAGECPISQAVFTVNEQEYCMRACATAEFEPSDISGLYYNWEVTEDIEVGYCAGKVHLSGEVGYISWIDIAPGINYNLSTKEGATKETLVEMANFVFVEVQGNS